MEEKKNKLPIRIKLVDKKTDLPKPRVNSVSSQATGSGCGCSKKQPINVAEKIQEIKQKNKKLFL